MKYLDFEKHIKKELGNSSEPVQMDALLNSLNLGDQKPKRKGFAFWMLLPFLLLLGSLITFNFMGNESFVENTATTPSELIDNQDDIHTPVQTSLNKENKEENSTNNISIASENAEITLTTLSESSNQESQNALAQGKNKNYKQLQNVSTGIQSTLVEKETQNVQIADDLNTEFSNPANSSTSTSNATSSNSDDLLNNSYLKRVEQEVERSTNASANTPILVASEEEVMISRAEISVQDLSTSTAFLDDREIDGNMFSRMKINCPSFDNSGWHMALIPEVGIFKPFKTLENIASDESAAFNERLNSESTLEGLEIGLYGMLVRDKLPLYLKAGVSYSRISERMDLQYEYVELDTTVGIISTTISGNGDTITHIYGDIVTETTYKGSNRQHHYIHLFDFPVSVGYTTYLGGLDIGIEAGVRVNFMTRATGNLLTSQREYTNLSLNRLFKNRVGVSYFGGLMIGRNFGKFGDIYIAPRFTYFPSDFNNQNNNVRQRYFNIGLNAGVVYKIN